MLESGAVPRTEDRSENFNKNIDLHMSHQPGSHQVGMLTPDEN